MGIGPIALTTYVRLASKGLLRRGQSVLELGAQVLFVEKCPHLVNHTCEAFHVPWPALMPKSSRDLMHWLGFEYWSIDLDGTYGALRDDLNEVVEFDRTFDLVTNHGTSEHVFNQAAVFETMHRAADPDGGLMLHCVPHRGYPTHSFYLYQPEFFDDLANANGYDKVGIWTTTDDHVKAALVDWKRGIRDERSGNILIVALLRRTTTKEFVAPMQGLYRGLRK